MGTFQEKNNITEWFLSFVNVSRASSNPPEGPGLDKKRAFPRQEIAVRTEPSEHGDHTLWGDTILPRYSRSFNQFKLSET